MGAAELLRDFGDATMGRGVPFKCRLAFCANDSNVNCGITVSGPWSAGASGAAGVDAAAGVSGVAKPLGRKRPGGGVRPTEVEPKEPPGDRTRDTAAGVVEREVEGWRTNCTGVNCEW